MTRAPHACIFKCVLCTLQFSHSRRENKDEKKRLAMFFADKEKNYDEYDKYADASIIKNKS